MRLEEFVGANVRSHRLRCGLTQQELATRAKINVRYLNQIENQALNITLDTIGRLSKALGIRPHQLLQETPIEYPFFPTSEEIIGLDSAIRILKSFRSLAKENTK